MSRPAPYRPGNPMRPPSRRGRLLGSAAGLFFLAYPVSDIVTQLHGAAAALASALLAVFVVAYFGAFATGMARGPRRRWQAAACVVAMAALAVALPFVYGGNWIVLSFYVAILLTVVLPRRAAIVGIALVVVFLFVQALVLGATAPNAAMNAIAAAAVGGLMLGFFNSRKLVVQLQQAQGEIARLAVAEERLRIARDLHDLLGHTLSLVALKSELAKRLSESDPSAAAREIADVEGVAREALAQVRQAVTGYRQQGLDAELNGARATLSAAGVEVTVRRSDVPLPAGVDELFAWAVREAATNVVRHARARHCEFVVSAGEQEARLGVVDDGVGPVDTGRGSGLAGLAERASAAGGRLESGEAAGGGFRLELYVPVGASAAGDASPNASQGAARVSEAS